MPPILTSGKVLSGNCMHGYTANLYGTGFTSDMEVKFFDLTTNTYTMASVFYCGV